jgi:putative addiction module component (TIGR02574 family)
MSIGDLRKLSRLEQLHAIEVLWESISHNDSDFDSPEWHKDVLDSRRKAIDSGEATFISFEELKNRVQK